MATNGRRARKRFRKLFFLGRFADFPGLWQLAKVICPLTEILPLSLPLPDPNRPGPPLWSETLRQSGRRPDRYGCRVDRHQRERPVGAPVRKAACPFTWSRPSPPGSARWLGQVKVAEQTRMLPFPNFSTCWPCRRTICCSAGRAKTSDAAAKSQAPRPGSATHPKPRCLSGNQNFTPMPIVTWCWSRSALRPWRMVSSPKSL